MFVFNLRLPKTPKTSKPSQIIPQSNIRRDVVDNEVTGHIRRNAVPISSAVGGRNGRSSGTPCLRSEQGDVITRGCHYIG